MLRQEAQQRQSVAEIGIVRRRAVQIVRAEPFPERGGGRRLFVARPELPQAPFRTLRRYEPPFLAAMKADQQAFQVRPEIDQLQIAAAPDGFRVAAFGAVLDEPVGVEKNQRSLVRNLGFVTPPAPVDGVFDDPSAIASAGDDDIEMKMQAPVVAQPLQQ